MPALAVCRIGERAGRGGGKGDLVTETCDVSGSRDLLERRRWSRLGKEDSEERARDMRERRRDRAVAPVPAGSDGPASGSSRCVGRTLKGLNACEAGRARDEVSGRASTAAADGEGLDEGAHDTGRLRVLRCGRRSEAPLELAWPMIAGRPAHEGTPQEGKNRCRRADVELRAKRRDEALKAVMSSVGESQPL